MRNMAIPVVEFSREGYKIRKVFVLTINYTQMKSLNFANWCNGLHTFKLQQKVLKSEFQSQFFTLGQKSSKTFFFIEE